MFKNNILIFNPGWDESANIIADFDDVRIIQKQLKENHIELEREADESSCGPASIVFFDTDRNSILIDQHI